ncbi:cytochrome P450 [Sporodiniella umbellata]|nr:cytochrome P450 [Sporodiniella umbellata]
MALDFDFLIQTIRSVDRKHISVLSTAIITIATAWWVGKVIKRSKGIKSLGGKKIPMPKGQYFYFGHMPSFRKEPFKKTNEWHKELGSIFQINAGVQHWIVIGDPIVAHDIFVSKGATSSGRASSAYAFHIHGENNRGMAFINNNKYWKQARSACLSSLSPKVIDSVHDTIEEETRKVIDILVDQYKKSPQGIDPIPYIRLYSLNNILSNIFGLPGKTSVDDDFFKEANYVTTQHFKFITIVNDLSSYYPILSFLDFIFQKEKKMRKFVNQRQRPFFRELVKQGRQSDRPSMLKELYKAKETYDLDDERITVITIEMTAGGVDTTSATIGFAVAILCHYPDWQKKMQTEIDNFVKKQGRMPKYTERSELPVVLAVMKETIRYKTTTYFGIPHRATEDIVYKDYIIPKDTMLIGNSYAANMFCEDPYSFNPERFMGDFRSIAANSNSSGDSRKSFNFGWGRRMCPGIYLSETEEFLWLCHLLVGHTIEPTISPDGQKIYPEIDNVQDYGAFIYPLPYKIRLTERKLQS